MRPYLRAANVYEANIDTSDVLSMNFTPEEYEVYRLEHGDILLNEGQSLEWVGRPAMYRNEVPGACFQNTLVRFRCHEGLLPAFALYVFRWYLRTGRFQRIAKWTTNIAHLGAARFAELEFPLPPRGEQYRIVEELEKQFSRLDVGRAALKRTQANLRRYRASVLKAACEGRVVSQDPNDEPASELLKRILAERRAGWEAEQFAPLPENWCYATLDQLLMEPLTNGRSVRPASEGFPVLRLTALRNGKINLTKWKIGAWEETDAQPYLVKKGDFFVSRGNGSISLVGRGGLIEVDPPAVAYPDLLIRVRAKPALIHPQYLRAIWDSMFLRRQIESTARTTAGIYKINQQDMRRFIIPLPPLAEQHRIVAEVERRLSVVDELEATVQANLKRAERLRQAILKRAFEGKLVPQDPTDEPASVLLERIRAQRDQADRGPTRARRQVVAELGRLL